MAPAKKPSRHRYTQADFHDFTHTGPGTLAGRYLRTFWWPLCRSDDLKTGRARPARILNEDFTLYRGEGGEAALLAPRCAHRGELLSVGWVEGDCLRCFYHGWKYDASGQCVEQPAEDPAFKHKIRIRAYPALDYLGLVFAYLGDGEKPPLPRYPFMETVEDSTCIRAVGTNTRPYNYRNRIENSIDPVHIAFVHRNSEYRGLTGYPEVSAEETDYGLILHSRRPGGEVRISQFQMPTILYIKQGPRLPFETAWRDFLAWRVPVDDHTNTLFSVSLVRVKDEEAKRRFREINEAMIAKDPAPEMGDAVLAGKIHIDDIDDPKMRVNVQDYVAQMGQGAIADTDSERLGRSDAAIILLRKIFARELRALASHKPLKQWKALTPAATTGL
ncbi:MAG TPA: Rieske 2Fe-2S domain-containing protein [Candidatus Binatia bacterium]